MPPSMWFAIRRGWIARGGDTREADHSGKQQRGHREHGIFARSQDRSGAVSACSYDRRSGRSLRTRRRLSPAPDAGCGGLQGQGLLPQLCPGGRGHPSLVLPLRRRPASAPPRCRGRHRRLQISALFPLLHRQRSSFHPADCFHIRLKGPLRWLLTITDPFW